MQERRVNFALVLCLLACPGKDGCVTTRRAALACHNSASPCPQPAPEWPELPPFLLVPDWSAARQGVQWPRGTKKRADWILDGCVGGRHKCQAARAAATAGPSLQPPTKNGGPMTDILPDNARANVDAGHRLPTKGSWLPWVSTLDSHHPLGFESFLPNSPKPSNNVAHLEPFTSTL